MPLERRLLLATTVLFGALAVLMVLPYEQYLLNRIREDLGFLEVPVRLIFKSRSKDGGKRVRTH